MLNKIKNSQGLQNFAAAGIILILVGMVEILTNRVEQMTGHVWDFVYYIDLAKNGLIGNDHLAAPYAYRALTPLLARWINQAGGFDLPVGFRVLSYIGILLTLYGCFVFARRLTGSFIRGLILMLLPVFSLFNVKFLLFDSYRPDLLAYALLVWGILALMDGRTWWVALAALVGIQMREFPVIPLLIHLYQSGREWLQNRSRWDLVWQSLVLAVALALAILLPRLLIQVRFTQQILDPQNDPNFIKVLLLMPLEPKRDFNYIYNLLSYHLPVLMLVTGPRLKAVWNWFGKYRAWLIIYYGVILLGMTYGGTDMMRYVSYLFIPLIFWVAGFMAGDLHPAELVWALVAMVIFNRILLPFPIWDYTTYISFYGGYGDVVNAASFQRLAELFIYILTAMTLRKFINFTGMSRAKSG